MNKYNPTVYRIKKRIKKDSKTVVIGYFYDIHATLDIANFLSVKHKCKVVIEVKNNQGFWVKDTIINYEKDTFKK